MSAQTRCLDVEVFKKLLVMIDGFEERGEEATSSGHYSFNDRVDSHVDQALLHRVFVPIPLI